MDPISNFLRYPGSKRRMLSFLLAHLPDRDAIKGRFIEPFLGSGAVYFAISPRLADLGDKNSELVEIYRGITRSPDRVWRLYRSFPTTKKGFQRIRALDPAVLTPLQRAARSLFLNRTCFKGMWRHNLKGQFNIGYGGQDRRWSIRRSDLLKISSLLQNASLECCDFEQMLDRASKKDYVFLDPPYRPGKKEQLHAHYGAQQFRFTDHSRLARALRRADRRRVPWSITISDHPDILALYKGFSIAPIPRGTGSAIGILADRSGEVLISN
jgi:DNA adenine methylase